MMKSGNSKPASSRAKFHVVWVLLALASQALPAFGQASIQGRVTLSQEGSPAPLANALVRLYEAGTKRIVLTRTDRDGRYSLENLALGRHLLEIETQGQIVYQGVVPAESVAPVMKDIALEVAEPVDTGRSGAKPGVNRWPIKTSLPEGTTNPRSVLLHDLLMLPAPPDVRKYDPRYQKRRIPPFGNPLNLNEGELVTTTGWLYLVASEMDGDYHIQIADSPTSGDGCLIVEIPNPSPAFGANAALQPLLAAARAFVKQRLLVNQEPFQAGSVLQHPVYLTITGQLFFDTDHVGSPPRGKKGMRAATLWELHPVTSIAFAPKPK